MKYFLVHWTALRACSGVVLPSIGSRFPIELNTGRSAYSRLLDRLYRSSSGRPGCRKASIWPESGCFRCVYSAAAWLWLVSLLLQATNFSHSELSDCRFYPSPLAQNMPCTSILACSSDPAGRCCSLKFMYRLSCAIDCLSVLGIAFGFYLATLLVRDPDYLATRDRIRMQAKASEDKARSEKLKQKLYERTLGGKGLRMLALQKLTKGTVNPGMAGIGNNSNTNGNFQALAGSYPPAPQPAVYAGYNGYPAQQQQAYGMPPPADSSQYYGQQGY